MSKSPPNILIVDDNAANLKALQALLSSVRANVLEASCGNDALGLILEYQLALIILDVEMPEMDGYEVAAMVNGLDQTRGIPIIFITAAYRDDHHRLKGFRAGAVDYIEKPIQDDILLAKVKVFLDLFQAHERLCASNRSLREEMARREVAEQHLQLTRFAVDQMGDAAYLIDPDARLLDVNNAACALLGYAREELLTMGMSAIDPGFSLDAWADHWRELNDIGSQVIESRHRTRDGREMPVEIHASRLEFKGQACIFALATDITERKQAEEVLRQAASVFEHVNEGILITDVDTNILDVNSAFSRITGYSRDEVLGRSPSLLQSGRHDSGYYADMWRELNENGHWAGEIWNRRKDGEVYAEFLTISAVQDKLGNKLRYVGLFSDITVLKRQQVQLEHMAYYDVLTGLPNRVLLADRLNQTMIRARRHGTFLAVVYMDLDGFKAINDVHGHDAGDQLLIKVSQGMKRALREGDILSRLGGDEFVAVLPDLGEHQACVHVLDRLLKAAAEPASIEGQTLRVTASLGVSFFPQDEDVDADQLQRQADQAMYQSKQGGKNRYRLFDVAAPDPDQLR